MGPPASKGLSGGVGPDSDREYGSETCSAPTSRALSRRRGLGGWLRTRCRGRGWPWAGGRLWRGAGAGTRCAEQGSGGGKSPAGGRVGYDCACTRLILMDGASPRERPGRGGDEHPGTPLCVRSTTPRQREGVDSAYIRTALSLQGAAASVCTRLILGERVLKREALLAWMGDQNEPFAAWAASWWVLGIEQHWWETQVTTKL